MAVSGTEAQIYEALAWFIGQQALELTPPFDPALGKDVSFPGVAFSPKLRKPYLDVAVIPNGAELIGHAFDSAVEAVGLLQIAVMWPAGEGNVKPMQVAGQVVLRFKPGTVIARNDVEIRFEEQPQVAAPLQESDWTRVPVTIRWRASAPPNA
ncbi:phage tail terminator-like protein [Methylobacterium isbiliense]|uniref:Uncharacterized protein n=1 Tax=Methylobacterium isbiliense TaxID=315478 RepID=A0ABQ4SBZ9_9HYPH|nr:phage tail terminator-like protein [Methylobacterium isbiliense]MDN3622604.1 phage tail terminator-like protein [Methylobacterium isbiliense]GJE00547.1 hypothetical protein GMJLKIPL_2470 [Methylobacterium isbiliense]